MLDIEFNNLTFLSTELMKKLNLILTPRVEGNPWHCPCWDMIRQWIPWWTYKITSPRHKYGEPRCIVSKHPADECIQEVDEEMIMHYSKHISSTENNTEGYCKCIETEDEDCHQHI